jgi:hypothetical protein
MFQPVPSESGVDVEYQVPTSSQRDHEDEVIALDSEEDDEDGIADDGVSISKCRMRKENICQIIMIEHVHRIDKLFIYSFILHSSLLSF